MLQRKNRCNFMGKGNKQARKYENIILFSKHMTTYMYNHKQNYLKSCQNQA